MRICVTGGRDYSDQKRVDETLDLIHNSDAGPIERVAHGHCTDRHGKLSGADKLAHEWARRRGVPVFPYPADWDSIDHPGARIRVHPKTRRPYNAAAGPQRNLRMLIEEAPQLVIGFPGGTGTQDCCAKALRRDISVLTVDA